jgi:hypothetical protein
VEKPGGGRQGPIHTSRGLPGPRVVSRNAFGHGIQVVNLSLLVVHAAHLMASSRPVIGSMFYRSRAPKIGTLPMGSGGILRSSFFRLRVDHDLVGPQL